jgi:hypothetical protein
MQVPDFQWDMSEARLSWETRLLLLYMSAAVMTVIAMSAQLAHELGWLSIKRRRELQSPGIREQADLLAASALANWKLPLRCDHEVSSRPLQVTIRLAQLAEGAFLYKWGICSLPSDQSTGSS